GLISLGGVLLGFVVHLVAASVGLTALLLAVPIAFDAIRLAGAAYLLWLAWEALRPGGRTPFQPRQMDADSPAKLLRMGFITNLRTPRVAMSYLAFSPQFLQPEQGSVLLQSLQLGTIQILVSGGVNALLVLGAARIADVLARRRIWLA